MLQPSGVSSHDDGDSLLDPVVACAKPSPHPYSSLCLSPDRKYACCASKDSLHLFHVVPAGLRSLRVIPIAQHFHASAAAATNTNSTQKSTRTATGRFQGSSHSREQQQQQSGILDAFLGPSSKQASAVMPMNVTVTCVAWSPSHSLGSHQLGEPIECPSYIAAAGSNGVIVVFVADSLVDVNTSPIIEVVLCEHLRAVNGLDWHAKLPGLLLSASQDGTVLLWEKDKTEEVVERGPRQFTNPALTKLFGGHRVAPKRVYTWECRSRFEPKSEAARDIQWNPFYEDVFALVTTSGSLIAYNRHITVRALVKLTAHSGDASSLDWHPLRRNVIATGGANDKTVKVWNLEEFLSVMDKSDHTYMAMNAHSMASRTDSANSEDDFSDIVAERDERTTTGGATPLSSNAVMPQPWHLRSYSPSSTYNTNNSSRHSKGPAKALMHALAVSASVTRIRWRPPASLEPHDTNMDLHSTMMAVATAPIKGASAGGSGLLGLWTCDRPYVPLRIVQGHTEGAVTDFEWLETPEGKQVRSMSLRSQTKRAFHASASPDRVPQGKTERRGSITGSLDKNEAKYKHASHGRIYGSSYGETDILFDNSERDDDTVKAGRIWQHVLSVGRDGRCMIQSFLRGDNPMSRVPPSCFAMANLSPFQKGYGSLQIFSVSQTLPSDPENAFLLTGLRRDSRTDAAPGVFREPMGEGQDSLDDGDLLSPRKTFPSAPPDLVFHVVDQGHLDDDSKPVDEQKQIITVAPEVVHLSRFASRYILYPNDKLTSCSALCIHNGAVAESLKCGHLAHMWRMVASMLDSCGIDRLPDLNHANSSHVMQFVVLPTLKGLLEERAEDGDVQTCVALCELLGVVKPDLTLRIPDLSLSLVREWYLSYIDLLKDMCLFSHASYLIRSCSDPFIGALNQQSTTIHESCPSCGKPLLASDRITSGDDQSIRRTCRSCRKRVGLCFLCHEPVKGMFVWCPGCGHGGHLDHALQWFGGLQGKAVREACPTGCGHKCNLLQPTSAFPRTKSLKEMSALGCLPADPLNEFCMG